MRALLAVMILTLSCTTTPVIRPAITAESVSACLGKIANRGAPKLAVVKDIIEAVRETPESVFAVNNAADIYGSVANEMGPYRSLKHRAAVMAQVMIVQSGFESSWKYGEARDLSASNTAACTEEAGLYQTSGNMNTFNATAKSVLIPFQAKYCKSTTCDEFRRCTKEPVKAFTHGHFMRAARITTRHWGPMVRKEINPWLKRECVKQIEALL